MINNIDMNNINFIYDPTTTIGSNYKYKKYEYNICIDCLKKINKIIFPEPTSSNKIRTIHIDSSV